MYYEYYLTSGLFAVLILLILYVNSIFHRGKTICDRLLRGDILVGILLGILDTVSWLTTGKDFPWSVGIQYITNGGADLMIVLISYLWFLYIFEELIGSVIHKKRKMMFISVPAILSVFLVLSTPVTHWIFYINEVKEYVRGTLYEFVLTIPFIYVLGASAMALFRYHKEVYESRKLDCLLLASFPVFPLVGSIIQAANFGLSLYVPCLTLSVLLIYLNQQNHNLTMDALTQLNNRGQLDRYLERRFSSFNKDENTYFLLMDVDYFKEINDTCGHVEGDDALVLVASALKQTFKQRDAFIARYGGDEFAVLMENVDQEGVEEIKEIINRNLNDMTDQQGKSYRLCISIGAVHCGMEEIYSVSDLIAAADKEMFRMKNEKKRI